MRFARKLSNKRYVTLPSVIREAMAVEAGDIIEFEVVRIIKKDAGEQAMASGAGPGVPV